MFAILVLACSTTNTDATDTSPSADGAFAAFPACTATSGDGRLDIEAGCADGACASQTYAEWVEILGQPECAHGSLNEKVECNWEGLSTYFDDVEEDDIVDDEGEQIGYFHVEDPWDGATSEGLAIGAEMRCFIDVLGEPSSYAVEGDLLTELEYDDPNFDVSGGDEGAADRFTVWDP